jgi:hypothetical protein
MKATASVVAFAIAASFGAVGLFPVLSSLLSLSSLSLGPGKPGNGPPIWTGVAAPIGQNRSLNLSTFRGALQPESTFKANP